MGKEMPASWCISIFFLLLYVCQVISVVPVCIPDQNTVYATPITWWFIRKFPGSWHYIYMDSQSDEVSYVQGNGLTDPNSALYLTLSQLPDGQNPTNSINDPSWVFYNDQPGRSYEILHQAAINGGGSKYSAHAKGVLAFEQDPNVAGSVGNGFHLTHSIPEFPVGEKTYRSRGVDWLKPAPAGVDPTFQWLANSYERGQTLFCYNINGNQVNSAFLQLIWMDAVFYHFNIPMPLIGNYPANAAAFLSTAQNRQAVNLRKAANNAGCNANNNQAACMNGLQFTNARWYSKPGFKSNPPQYGGDIPAMMANRLPANLVSQTELHAFGNAVNLRGRCGFGVVNTVFDGWQYRWPYQPNGATPPDFNYDCTSDHSKIMFMEDPQPTTPNNWVCIGDINRDTTNSRRGGGAVCVSNYKLALLLNRMTLRVDNCNFAGLQNYNGLAEIRAINLPASIFVEMKERNEPLNPRVIYQADATGAVNFRIRARRIPTGSLILTNGNGRLPGSTYTLLICTFPNIQVCDPSKADSTISIALTAPAPPNTWYTLDGNTVANNKRILVYSWMRELFANWPDGQPGAITVFATSATYYDVTNPGFDYIILPNDAGPLCQQSLMAQYWRLFFRRGNNFFFITESYHDMQAAPGTLTTTEVIYNSVINIAVILASNIILGGAYDPLLYSCYVAPPTVGPPVNIDMDLFVSAQIQGDDSEGWTTAFLLDMFDANDEGNFNTMDNTLGAVDHGDVYNGYSLGELRTAVNLLPDPNLGPWIAPSQFYLTNMRPAIAVNDQQNADWTATYNYLMQCTCLSCALFNSREVFDDPLLQSLNDAGICPGVLRSLSTDEVTTIREYLGQWVQNTDAYSTNQGIEKLLKDPNINDITTGTNILKTFKPAQFDVVRNNGTDLSVRNNVNLAQFSPSTGCNCGDAINNLVLDPNKVIDFTRTLYNLAFNGKRRTFDLYQFYYWQKKSWDQRDFPGIMVVMYNNTLCNFVVTTQDAFTAAVPTTTVCAFGPPVITSISKNAGPAGTEISINGYSFDSSAIAYIGGIACTQTVFVNENQVICTAPVQAGKLNLVTVTAREYTSNSSIFFSYPAPNVTGIEPSLGSTTEVTRITITGENFGPSTAVVEYVILGRFNCTNIQHISDTSIVCDAPPGVGMDNFVYVSVGGQSSSLEQSVNFDYPAPIIDSITPSSGTCEGGVPVTIRGQNMGSFNATPAGFGREMNMFGGLFWFTDVHWVSDTELTAISPPGIGLGNPATVVVDGTPGEGGSFNYPAPTITPDQPLFADTIGGPIDMFGTSFSPFLYYDAVEILSLNGERIDYNDNGTCTYLSIIIPPGVGADFDLFIRVAGQQSNTVKFSYYPPWINYTSDLVYAPKLDIYGLNFVPAESEDYTGGADVSLNNVTIQARLGTVLCPVISWSSTFVNCTVPAGYYPIYNVTVYVGGQASATYGNIEDVTPVVDSIDPDHGSIFGYTLITITGSNFLPGGATTNDSMIYIGGIPCITRQWVTVNTATCMTPPGVGLLLPVVVQVNGLSSEPKPLFSYDLLTPVVNSISPNHGPSEGNVAITIMGDSLVPTGSDAPDGSGIYIDGNPCLSVVWSDEHTANCWIPPGTGFNLSVVVIIAGFSSEPKYLFSYDAIPVVDHIDPDHGSIFGLTSVTIYGANFLPYGGDTSGSTITIGGTPCSSVQWVDVNTSICGTPPGIGSELPVVVQVHGLSSEPQPLFSYDAYIPVVTSIDPNHGPPEGNVPITIIGDNLIPSGATAPPGSVIFIGGSSCLTVMWIDVRTALCWIPPGTGFNLSVSVTIAGYISAANTLFSYDVDGPVLTTISPSHGSTSMNAFVTIIGDNLVPSGSPVPPSSSITINGTACAAVIWADEHTALCRITPGIGANLPVVVTLNGLVSNPVFFSYDAPVLNSITPARGPTDGHTLITVQGSNLVPTGVIPAGSTISVGGKQCLSTTWTNDASALCELPPGTGSNYFAVIVGGVAAAPLIFAYDAPTVTSITPNSAPAGVLGVLVTIDGTNFGNGSPLPLVYLSNNDIAFQCLSLTLISSTRLTCKLSESSGSNLRVYVEVNGQGSTATPGVVFNFINDPCLKTACLDYVFCIDTTGSMYDDIDRVKAESVRLTDQLFDEKMDTRIAVVNYRDFANRTRASYDYPYQATSAWSRDRNFVKAAINSLTLGYGGDEDETVYSGAIGAIRGDGIGPWRRYAVKGMLILGDAPALDPEPFTGYTLDSLYYASNHVNDKAVRSTPSGTGSVLIYTVPVGDNSQTLSTFETISQGTGAISVPAATAGDVVDAISTAITDIINTHVLPPEGLNLTTTLSANSVPSGERAVITVSVANAGPSNATNAVVNVLGWAFTNSSCEGSGVTCEFNEIDQTATLHYTGAIPPGEFVNMELTGYVACNVTSNVTYSLSAYASSTLNITQYTSTTTSLSLTTNGTTPLCLYTDCFSNVSISQALVTRWTDNGQNISQWTVTITAGARPLFNLSFDLPTLLNFWRIDKITDHLYMLPAYQYVRGAIQPYTSIDFGYQITSFDAAPIHVINNACVKPFKNCSVAATQSLQNSYSTGVDNYRQYAVQFTNYGQAPTDFVNITLVLHDSTYTITQSFGMTLTSTNSATSSSYTVNLFSLFPGSSVSNIGYTVKVPASTETFYQPSLNIVGVECSP